MGVVTADWSRNVHDLPARLNVINRFIAAGSHLKVHHHLFWPSVLFCTAGRAFIFFNRLEKIADTFFFAIAASTTRQEARRIAKGWGA